jgi:predicted flap endonuclease-1-like 5' DNA nuclease
MVLSNNNTDCMNTCRWIAALIGLLGFVIFFWMADYRFISSLLLAALIGVASWFILKWMFCNDETDVVESSSSSAAASTTATSSTGAATETKAPAAVEEIETATASSVAASASNATVATASTAPSAAFSIKPSTPLAGEKELSERKGDWKYEAPVKEKAPVKAKAKAPAKSAKTPKAKATENAAAPKAKAPAKAKAADATPATLLSAARPEGKDDLKLISGVGPKLEQTLNDLGVYHYDQVAKWKKKDIAWVDDNLRFKGRIERDDWMAQAKILAKGGETEFSKKKKKT